MPSPILASADLEVRSRRTGRIPPFSWLVALASSLVAAVTLVLAVLMPPGEPVLISTRRIAIVRTSTGRELSSGSSPILRATRLIAMMRLDLTRLTEQQFLSEWGDHTRWRQRFADREREARAADHR